MSISRTVSEINGNSVKNRNFFHTRVFDAPLKGFHFELGISDQGRKTRMMGLLSRERSLTRYLHPCGHHPCPYTKVTDRQTPDDSKDRAYIERRAVKKIVTSKDIIAGAAPIR